MLVYVLNRFALVTPLTKSTQLAHPLFTPPPDPLQATSRPPPDHLQTPSRPPPDPLVHSANSATRHRVTEGPRRVCLTSPFRFTSTVRRCGGGDRERESSSYLGAPGRHDLVQGPQGGLQVASCQPQELRVHHRARRRVARLRRSANESTKNKRVNGRSAGGQQAVNRRVARLRRSTGGQQTSQRTSQWLSGISSGEDALRHPKGLKKDNSRLLQRFLGVCT
eukprot:1005259-Prorocentrum_minimum.AAC.1